MSKLHFPAAEMNDKRFAGFGYEVSVNYLGQTLTLISAPRGSKEVDVLAFAEAAHGEKFLRTCDEVRVAKVNERPETWQVNPMPGLLGEVWMVVVVWRMYAFFSELEGAEHE